MTDMRLSELYMAHLVDVRNACHTIQPSCVKIIANQLTPTLPVMLVSWDGMMKKGHADLGHTDGINWESNYLEVGPTTRIELPLFNDIVEFDRWVVRGACTLGAWDVIRSTVPEPLVAGAGINKPLLEPVCGDFKAVDHRELVRRLGRPGGVVWKFRPVFGSLRESLKNDSSLDHCGKRIPTYPIPCYIHITEGCPTVQYRIGTERRAVARQCSALSSVSI